MIRDGQDEPKAGEGISRTVRSGVIRALCRIMSACRGRPVNPDIPPAPMSFMFVCKGNVCRSPFAERFFIKIATEHMLGKKVDSFSAGMDVKVPSPPPFEAVSAARERGVDLSGHISREITKEAAEKHDMILAVELSQFDELRNRWPGLKDRIFLLSLFAEKGNNRERFLCYNIPDPYGKPGRDYGECYDIMTRCLKGLLEAVEVQDENI